MIDILQESITRLLTKAGFATTVFSIKKCEKGGNNRTYRIETSDGVFAVKKYFRQVDDKRDRLAAEFAFLSYAKRITPNSVPTAFCYDAENGLALYEFIEGLPFEPNTISEQDITHAITFFCALNLSNEKRVAEKLPIASEACFTMQAHIDLIEARINELQKFIPLTEQDKLAKDYIQQLKIVWSSQAKNIKKVIHAKNFYKELDASQRCLSPSDFGFHNALRVKTGGICFLDFEYAGWDDPAKMTGDFFAQLAVPIPPNYFDYFVRQVMSPFSNTEELIERAYRLRYAYQVKWCCIALNIFLPSHLARRRFANPLLDINEIKTLQLAKVATLINYLDVLKHGNN